MRMRKKNPLQNNNMFLLDKNRNYFAYFNFVLFLSHFQAFEQFLCKHFSVDDLVESPRDERTVAFFNL